MDMDTLLAKLATRQQTLHEMHRRAQDEEIFLRGRAIELQDLLMKLAAGSGAPPGAVENSATAEG
jgi:hypothetical protein